MKYQALPRVAYYCMEFGLSADLTIYSGGLGVLAGDLMKAVGDLRLPLVGIGLLWDKGYTHQTIGADGRPVDEYVPTDRHALQPTGVTTEISIRGETIELTAHRVRYYTDAELYLLEPTEERHRWITRSLYGGSHEDRIAQEMVLGIGGVRMLQALGIDVDVHHFNEGHAVFAGHELLRQAQATGLSFEDALAKVREKVVFTTHTPVPAGNEVHGIDLLHNLGAALHLSNSELERLGGNPYGMTVAGLRLCRIASAVAELHGETAREMWKHVEHAAPIVAVTNGVHAHSWQDARVRSALAADKPTDVQRAELRSAHAQMKAELFAAIKKRIGVTLDPNKLTIGFARRAATYKRANLILGNPDRLKALLDRGVQLVYAGKAHPADEHGKSMVATLVAASRDFPGQIVFMENYDMVIGALLTRGCDIWLNNPRRPKEACGTSGMKAAMNGVPNCSILDGWWPEGCKHGVNGWQIKADYQGETDEHACDIMDRDELYRVLEDEVVPAYADKERWTNLMIASIRMSSWHFSSARMVQDYYDLLYRR